jgi:23S rRNA pseudouridine1911/1915/1917 synthase
VAPRAISAPGAADTDVNELRAENVRALVVDRGDARRRLDRLLLERLPQAAASRTRIQRWIEAGRVRVDDVVVTRTAARVLEGQRVELRLPGPPRLPPQPEPLPIAVLYEDAHLLAVDKPAGQVVHPTKRYPTGTLVNALLWYGRGEIAAGRRLRLVHRLDRETSGVLLVSKSREVHAAVARAMGSGAVRKEYLALVYGAPPADRGSIELPVRDRPSTTHYELIARSSGPRAGLSLLQCTLGTGRLHQIRLHLSGIGLPIVGDPRYGEPRWTELADATCAQACAAFPRQALHARRLRLTHPIGGAALDLHAPLPPDFTALLTAAGFSRP